MNLVARGVDGDGKTKRLAHRWLREMLEAGSQSSEYIMAKVKELGFSASTIYRAAAALSVTMEQQGQGNGSTWSLNNQITVNCKKS
jgi:hypothetical protein